MVEYIYRAKTRFGHIWIVGQNLNTNLKPSWRLIVVHPIHDLLLVLLQFLQVDNELNYATISAFFMLHCYK